MFKRSFRNVSKQSIASDDVRQKNVCNKEGNHKEHKPFQRSFPNFFGIPGLLIQTNLSSSVSVDPIFNSSENHFHKNRLRTNPSAKNPSKGSRKQNNKDYPYNHRDYEQIEILWPERESENVKPPLQDVKHQKLVSVKFYERRHHENGEKNITYYFSIVIIPSRWFFRINPNPFSFFTYCRDSVSKAVCF